MLEAARASDVDTALDGVDPGRAGIRNDDPGRSQDRKSANNAKTRIERPGGERFAAGDGEFDGHIAGGTEILHHFANGRSHHFARDGIDGGLAGREWQAGLGHGADAFAGKEGNAGTRPARSDSCLDQGAMRDVRIVPGIFHDSRGRPSVEGFEDSNCKADTCAIRKPHVDGIRALTSDERLVCRACGGRRAGARGPAALERLIRSGLICICGVAHVLFQSGAPKLNTISS